MESGISSKTNLAASVLDLFISDLPYDEAWQRGHEEPATSAVVAAQGAQAAGARLLHKQ